jgi:hypothetical protein
LEVAAKLEYYLVFGQFGGSGETARFQGIVRFGSSVRKNPSLASYRFAGCGETARKVSGHHSNWLERKKAVDLQQHPVSRWV